MYALRNVKTGNFYYQKPYLNGDQVEVVVTPFHTGSLLLLSDENTAVSLVMNGLVLNPCDNVSEMVVDMWKANELEVVNFNNFVQFK